MADGKNTIVVYRDWINIFEKLTDQEAGQLAKHLFRYVNDLNPTSDRLIELVFEPIKQTLKRDLQHWENVKKIRSDIGRKGGLKSGESRSKPEQKKANEANASIMKQNESNEAVSVIDSDSDIIKYKYSEFYDFEIELNRQAKEIKSYEACVMFLHGTNELKKPLITWLKLENQITYIQYETLLKKSREKGRKISEMLLSGFNDPKHLKGKKSIYLTLNNWLNITKK